MQFNHSKQKGLYIKRRLTLCLKRANILRPDFADLSKIEQKMMRLIILGYSNREIGEAPHYFYDYVKRVVSFMYEKKFVSSRGEPKSCW